MYKVGFIGTGNMSSALAKAISKVDNNILLANRTLSKIEVLALSLNCDLTDDNLKVAKESEYIFLGVKPQVLPLVLEQIKETLRQREDNYILVSMAAGTTISKIKEMLGFDAKIIRIMPNLPVELSSGVTLVSKDEITTLEELNGLETLLKESGLVLVIDENKINAGSALSGSGPAFVYMFIESLVDGAISCGLTYDQAIKLASQTLIGSANMVLNTNKHPGQLKVEVCSPGGTTIEGVKTLEDNGFRGSVIDAVINTYKKNIELSKK